MDKSSTYNDPDFSEEEKVALVDVLNIHAKARRLITDSERVRLEQVKSLANFNYKRGTLIGYTHEENKPNRVVAVIIEIPEGGFIDYKLLQQKDAIWSADPKNLKSKVLVIKDLRVAPAILRTYFSDGISEFPGTHSGDGFVEVRLERNGTVATTTLATTYNRFDLVNTWNSLPQSAFDKYFPDGKVNSADDFVEAVRKHKSGGNDGYRVMDMYSRMKSLGFNFITRVKSSELTVYTNAAEVNGLEFKVADPNAKAYGVPSDEEIPEHFDIYLKADKESLVSFWESVDQVV